MPGSVDEATVAMLLATSTGLARKLYAQQAHLPAYSAYPRGRRLAFHHHVPCAHVYCGQLVDPWGGRKYCSVACCNKAACYRIARDPVRGPAVQARNRERRRAKTGA